MRHARSDYAQIQDGRPEGERIPDDEPVFLLRAKDRFGPVAVLYWAAVAKENGADAAIVEAARRQARAMERYAMLHHNGGKVPDAPAEAV